MIAILPDNAGNFHADQLLDFLQLVSIVKQEIAKETKHRRFLLSLFWQVIDKLDYFFDERVEVVIDKQFTIFEYLRDQADPRKYVDGPARLFLEERARHEYV